MWQHNYEPIAGSLGVSAIAAALPIVVLFVMLGVLRKPAWMSAATALASGLLVSLIVYRMPVDLALISTIYGAAFGIFPIAWIVFASIMLYRLAVDTGKFEIIKDSIGGLTTDRRLQAMFIAFSFGAFIEGAAGFGAPVAISGAMLAGLGFNPFYAAGICLLANTAPVAFGSIGIPVITLANVTGLPVLALSAMVGTLCAMISVFIPGYLIVVMAGWKRAVEVLPAILACGLSFAGMQYYVSNNLGPELTDIMSSLTCIVVMVIVLKVWTPKTIMRLEGDKPATLTASKHSMGEVFVGWLPYLLLVVFVLTWGEPAYQGGHRPLDSQHPPLVPAGEWDRAEQSGSARPAQPDHSDTPRHGEAVSLRSPLRVQLAECLGNGVHAGDHCGSRALAREPEAVRRHLQGDVQATGNPHGDHRPDAWIGVLDELLRNDLDARARACHQRWRVPVLQRHTRMARCLPYRQRHICKRAVR